MELYSKEAEKALLSCLIQDENKRIDLATKINIDDFYSEQNKLIYQAIYKIDNEANIEVDLVTLAEKLRPDMPGASTYLTKLLDTGFINKAESYLSIIKDKSLRRRLRKASNKISSLVEDDREAEKISAEAEELLFNINENEKLDRSSINIKDFLIDHIDEVCTPQEEKEGGLQTQFSKLNEVTGGLYGSELSIVAGESGMGKTTLALNICHHISKKNPVGIISLEMNKKKLINRVLASETEIDYMKLKRGTTNEEEMQRITDVAGEMYDKGNINLNDTPGLTISEIRSEARKMKKRNNIELCLVDYSDLITGGREETEALRLQKIARSLRNMAKELDIHVMLICQISRGIKNRNDKRPLMSDLKGSSGLEQAADLILMIYRESEYNKEFKQEQGHIRNITEILFTKNREGEKSTLLLDFEGRYYKFSQANNYQKEQYSNFMGWSND